MNTKYHFTLLFCAYIPGKKGKNIILLYNIFQLSGLKYQWLCTKSWKATYHNQMSRCNNQ